MCRPCPSTGDIALGRANLTIAGGEVTANRLVSAAQSPDYGALAITGGTLRLTNGIDSSTNGPVPFSMNLTGGALYTPSIRVGDWEQPDLGINVWSDSGRDHHSSDGQQLRLYHAVWHGAEPLSRQQRKRGNVQHGRFRHHRGCQSARQRCRAD